jgi:hypothetical protein
MHYVIALKNQIHANLCCQIKIPAFFFIAFGGPIYRKCHINESNKELKNVRNVRKY